MWRWVVVAMVASCRAGIDEMPEVYYRGPGARLLCATSVDDDRAEAGSIRAGLARAADDGSVLQLYAHEPGRTISEGRLDTVLDGARQHGLAWYTYRDLADGVAVGPGIALSFDDDSIDAWHQMAPRLSAVGARATFFVSGYRRLTPADRDRLRDLASRGHAIEAHSVDHRHWRAARADAAAAYVRDQVDPDLTAMRADGFDPRAFAYPYGERDDQLDGAIWSRFAIARTTAFAGKRDRDGCP